MRTYLWIEDRKGKAAFTFWETFVTAIFPDYQGTSLLKEFSAAGVEALAI